MANPTINRILYRWHRMMGLPRQSRPSWYRDRLREELHELRTATGPIQRLSETADVFFAISRARHDGIYCRWKLPTPFVASRHAPVYAYMLVKYTLRWSFYRTAAVITNAPRPKLVREVINPWKDGKLDQVSRRHDIDQERFRRVAGLLRRFWPLLP